MLVKLGSGNELGSLLGTLVRMSFQPKTAWNRCGQRRRLQRQGRGRGRREKPVGSPGVLEDIRTVPGAMEWDPHDTVTLGDEY